MKWWGSWCSGTLYSGTVMGRWCSGTLVCDTVMARWYSGTLQTSALYVHLQLVPESVRKSPLWNTLRRFTSQSVKVFQRVSEGNLIFNDDEVELLPCEGNEEIKTNLYRVQDVNKYHYTTEENCRRSRSNYVCKTLLSAGITEELVPLKR